MNHIAISPAPTTLFRSFLVSSILCFGLVQPASAQTDCPTAEDLKTGIRFDVAGGEWEVFRRFSDDVVEARYYFDASGGARNLLAQGIYLLEWMDFDGDTLLFDTRATYTFPEGNREFPVPTEGGGWNTQSVMLSTDGLKAETQIYEFGSFQQRTFGACAYRMMPITITYIDADGNTENKDILHWLPDLGLSYLAGSEGKDYTDRYDYVAIRVVR